MPQNTQSNFRKTKLSILGLSILTLSGCLLQNHYMRHEVAHRVGHAAWMLDREIPAAPFSLTAYERIHERGGTANLYIEGDGSLERGSQDPSPKNPVALHLASKDKADNVIYIARPCQYSGLLDGSDRCPVEEWQGRLYAPEVTRSYNTAMNEIKKRYNISGFNLIGFDGGAAIAAELAGQRSDILSLRTVAGKLDKIRNPGSLDDVPQRHFIGGQDEEVPPSVLHSYMKSVIGPTKCADYTFIQEAAHMEGWVSKWPELLREPVTCHGEPKGFDALELLPYDPPGVFTARPKPAKP
ncbi:MAG: peptidase [Micavibrio sp.]|nr:MAG: peptidase [Micavibrio sp.]